MMAGRWEFRFTADSVYSVIDPAGERMVVGTYSVRADTLTVTDLGGRLACNRDPRMATAIMTWKLAGDQLTLRTVNDPCPGRRAGGVQVLTVLGPVRREK